MRSHFASFQAVRIRIAASAAPERIRGSTDSKFYLVYDALISLGLRFCQKASGAITSLWLPNGSRAAHIGYPSGQIPGYLVTETD
jgi:hypothetical protein